MSSILLHPFSQAYHHSATLLLISKIFGFIIFNFTPYIFSRLHCITTEEAPSVLLLYCPLLSTCSFSRLLKYSHKVRLSASIYDPVQKLLDRVRATRQHLPSSFLLVCIASSIVVIVKHHIEMEYQLSR
jgi:hypothetical protein